MNIHPNCQGCKENNFKNFSFAADVTLHSGGANIGFPCAKVQCLACGYQQDEIDFFKNLNINDTQTEEYKDILLKNGLQSGLVHLDPSK